MLATAIELTMTLGLWGAGEGAGFLLWLPLLLFKFLFFALFLGFFFGGFRRPRPPRRRRPNRPTDPAREAERRQEREDLRKAEEEVDSWTRYDL